MIIADAVTQPPYGEVALLIAFFAFLAVIIEITLLRRSADLEHDLRLPLDEAPRASSGRTSTGGEAHVD